MLIHLISISLDDLGEGGVEEILVELGVVAEDKRKALLASVLDALPGRRVSLFGSFKAIKHCVRQLLPESFLSQAAQCSEL